MRLGLAFHLSFLGTQLFTNIHVSLPTSLVLIALHASNADARPTDSGVTHTKLDSPSRSRIVQNIHQAFEEKYSLWHLKEKRLGLNIKKLFQECQHREARIAESTLSAFEDRMLLCLSHLKDTHVGLRALTARPSVGVGLSLKWIQNHLVIAGYDKKVLKWSLGESARTSKDFTWHQIFQPGTVVETVDGVPAQHWIQILKSFINGSSESFRTHEAAKAVALRDFFYPSKKTLVLKLSSQAEPVELEWLLHPVALREDLRELLLVKLGLRSSGSIGFDKFRPSDGYGPDFVGYDERQALPADELKEYLGSSITVPALYTGFLRLGDDGPDSLSSSAPCYLKLNNSIETELRYKNSPFKKESRSSILQNFLSNCQNNQRSLVLDLRKNPGGSFDVPLADLRHFLLKGESLPSGFTTGRFTGHLRRAYDVFSLGPEFPLRDWSEFSQDRFYRAVVAAEENGLRHIPAIPEQDITAFPTKEGEHSSAFGGRMVVITSSQCISGCELMANALRHRKETIFLGEPVNGTSGMIFTNRFFRLSSGWSDDLTDTIQIRLPNTIFGILPKISSDGRLIPFEEIEHRLTENQAYSVHVPHSPSLEDLKQDNKDLLFKIENTLRQ